MAASEETKGIKVFCSYSHKDEHLKENMEAHLSSLERTGIIFQWNDRKIEPGEDWDTSINSHLSEADIILLLISPDFVASDYCFSSEMKIAVDLHNSKKAKTIPVFIRPCNFKSLPFAKLQGLPKDANPITKWENEDDGWLDVTNGIERACHSISMTKNRTRKNSNKPPRSVKEFLKKEVDDLDDTYRSTNTRGLSTGISSLDELTCGLNKSNLIYLASRPSSGRESLLIQLLSSVCLNQKEPTLIFSLETPAQTLTRNIVSSIAKINKGKMLAASLESDDWPSLTGAIENLSNAPLFLEDDYATNIDNILHKCRTLKETSGLSVVFIDGIEHINEISTEQQEDHYRKLAKSLKQLSRDLCIPVVATGIISTSIESRPNRRPLLTDLGSESIFSDFSDLVLFTYLEQFIPIDGELEIIVSKNNNGPLGTCHVSIDSYTGEITDPPNRGFENL